MTGPAVVCWAAHFGWLHLAGTRLAFINRPFTLVVITSLALFELVADKLPQTPARTASIGLTARFILGGFCGAALATSARISPLLGALAAAAGGLAGAFAGYNVRRALASRLLLPDFAVALVEDAIAVASGLMIIVHV